MGRKSKKQTEPTKSSATSPQPTAKAAQQSQRIAAPLAQNSIPTKTVKKVADTLMSPPHSIVTRTAMTMSTGFSRLRTRFRLKNESSLAPSFLSTQHPTKTIRNLSTTHKVQLTILAVFLGLGVGYFTFADRVGSAFHYVSSVEQGPDDEELAFDEKAPADHAGSESSKDSQPLVKAAYTDGMQNGFDDSIPKASAAAPKVEDLKAEAKSVSKAHPQKAKGKKKAVSSKKSSKSKLATKHHKAKKTH